MQYSINDKKSLRNHFSRLREAVASAEKDAQICTRFLEWDRLRDADTVLLYSAFRSEVRTDDVFRGLADMGIPAAFPLCHKDGIMTFHLVSSLSQLTDGSYGIKEPDSSLPQPVLTDRSICIVPGLAFTAGGGRLGYGGGFYDRFLRENPCVITAAAAYSQQITPDLPLEIHDIRINYIFTDERMITCNEQK